LDGVLRATHRTSNPGQIESLSKACQTHAELDCKGEHVLVLRSVVRQNAFFTRYRSGATSPHEGERMLIILIILLLVFGFGGYRLGPGLGYYGGGGISLIILIVIILLLLKVI
jgi:hypothetical protein